MKYSFMTIDYERMAGIVTALKTHHGRGCIGKQINNLTFAFVAPLGTDYYN